MGVKTQMLTNGAAFIIYSLLTPLTPNNKRVQEVTALLSHLCVCELLPKLTLYVVFLKQDTGGK